MKEKETQYRREVLLKDPRFARYQPDFLAAVLNKPYYTLAEAQAAVKEQVEPLPYKTKSGRAFTFASGRRTNRI